MKRVHHFPLGGNKKGGKNTKKERKWVSKVQ
jgi:hypothetical protein